MPGSWPAAVRPQAASAIMTWITMITLIMIFQLEVSLATSVIKTQFKLNVCSLPQAGHRAAG